MVRRRLPAVLVGLGTLLAFLAIIAIWTGRQALETDQWTETSSKLLQQPVIRNRLADFLVEELYDNVDVAGELKAALPAQAQALAGPAAGALRSAATTAAKRVLQTPQAQAAWTDANRNAHKLLLRVIDGGGPAVATTDGVVKLDLKALLLELQRTAGVGGRLAGLLPADAASITILRSDQLSTVQDIAKALKPFGGVLVILMLACFGGAIALAGERRRQVLRSAGFGLIVAGLGALLARKALGTTVVDDLARTEAGKPAVQEVWSIATSLLVDVAAATILYGAVAVAAAWLAGPTRIAVRIRSALAPHLRDWRLAYGVLGGVVLLLLLWGPTEGFRRPLPAIVLIALLALAVEALRRQTAGELANAPAGVPPPDPQVGRSAVLELERLDEIHRNGGLDDVEFAKAKDRVLADQ
jgi:hypothetical protein